MTQSRKNLESGLPDLLSDLMAHLHTAQPGKVLSYDPVTNLAVVQPCLKRKYRGRAQAENLPVISDVPVVFPGSGDWFVTFPILPGHYVLLIFAERSISAWLDRGDLQDPNALRRFALSDAIAIPGILPSPDVLSPAPAIDGLEIRNRAGTVKMRLTSTGIEMTGGAMSLLGTSDFAVAFNALKSGFDTFVSNFNSFVGIYNGHTHICAAPGAASATPLPIGTSSAATIDAAKIASIKVP